MSQVEAELRLILVEAQVSQLEARLSHVEAELAEVRSQHCEPQRCPTDASQWNATPRL